MGYHRIVNLSTTCPGESLTYPVKFQAFSSLPILKTVRMHGDRNNPLYYTCIFRLLKLILKLNLNVLLMIKIRPVAMWH